jgi:uncharacterized protein (UPF0333 family)
MKSNKGQISLEFSILVMVVILSAIIVSYYLIKTAVETKDANVEVINESYDTTKNVLSNVT